MKKITFVVSTLMLTFLVGSLSTLAQEGEEASANTVGDITICGRPGTHSFNACYYEGQNFETFKVQRDDGPQINFDWGASSPDPVMSPDNFSAQWKGLFDFEEGIYEFTVTTDDGFRLFVDNEKIIDEWHDQPATTYTVRKTMEAGKLRGVIAHFYENEGDAVAKLDWHKVDNTTTNPEDGSESGDDSSTQYYPHADPTRWHMHPEQELGFTGSGFAPNETVRITDQSGNINESVVTDSSGTFAVTDLITVPFSWQNSTHSFKVVGEVSDSETPIAVTIGTYYPQIRPSTYWIGVNETMSVSGRGFAPNETVHLRVNGDQVAETQADSNGNITLTFTTPGAGSSFELSAYGVLSEKSSVRTIYTYQ